MKTKFTILSAIILCFCISKSYSQSPSVKHPMNVAILIYDGVELQDFAGPGEVFTSASNDTGNLFNVYTVATSSKEILSQNFLHVRPNYSIDSCPKPDIVIIPGGNTTIPGHDPKLTPWLLRYTNAGTYCMSVCTGAFLLAQTGALNGKMATTHYCCTDRLAETYPLIKVVKNERIVDNGKILTTEGVSAGIDGSLYLVSKLFGEKIAAEDAHYMMYDWRPGSLNKILND